MKIIELEQGSSEWLQWRKNGVCASDVASIMGEGYQNLNQVFDSKMPWAKETYVSSQMQLGKNLEPVIRDTYNLKHPETFFNPVCVEHENMPHYRASLDGFCEKTNSILEIKTSTGEPWELAKEGKVYKTYLWQMLWQMYVTKINTCKYVVHNPKLNETIEMDVNKDDELFNQMLPNVEKFWIDVQMGNCPEPESIYIDSKNFHKMEERYVKLHQKIKEMQDKLDSLRKEIIEIGDDGDFHGNLIKLKRVQPRVSYDMDLMKSDGIDLEKYKKPNNEIGYYRIEIKKP